jgi:hypothetical protein
MVAGAVGVPPRSARGRTISSASRFGSPGDATSATGTRSATRSRASSGRGRRRGGEKREVTREGTQMLYHREGTRGGSFPFGNARVDEEGREGVRGVVRDVLEYVIVYAYGLKNLIIIIPG